MKYTKVLTALLLVSVILFSGCSLKLPDVKIPYLTSDPIVCVVTAKDSFTLTCQVQREDSHYHEESVLLVHYETIMNGSSVNIGDQITFDYDYMADVTVKNDTPYIQVKSVAITHWEAPPETEAA